MKERRVVITGMAPICAMGSGSVFFDSLYEKKIILKELDEETRKKHRLRSRFVVPCPDIEKLSRFDDIASMCSHMSNNSILSCISSSMALDDAGLEKPYDDTAVIIGMGTGNTDAVYSNINAHITANKFYPLGIPVIMPNAAASWISIIHNCHGPSYTLNLACASSTAAIGQAYMGIKNGSFSSALCGGAECFTKDNYFMLKGFEYLHTLTKSNDGIPRVFSKERTGFLFNEGASCILMLEELEAAKNRNARIYAEITGYESTSDAYNIVRLNESGEQIKSMLSRLIGGSKVDYYNAHGTGTQVNDETETKVIIQFFKGDQPYINSTKGILGHTIGASGAIEACVCADSIFNGRIHGNLLGTPEEGLNLTCDAVYKEVESAVSVSFGFGGHNAALMLKKI